MPDSGSLHSDARQTGAPHIVTPHAVVETSSLGFQVTCHGTPIGAQHGDGGSLLVFRARRHAQSFAEAWNDEDDDLCSALIDDHGIFYSGGQA